jgi:hypothetical protein
MTDINSLAQLVNSMADAVYKLEDNGKLKNKEDMVKLKAFILDLHNKINEALGG